MELLNYLGIGLIILSALSGLAIYIDAFLEGIDNIAALGWLFVLSLVGGAILYGLGNHTFQGIVYSSYILLLLGCLSATTIFFGEINFFTIRNKNILWIYFLICTPIGVVGIYHENLMIFLTQY